MNYLFVANSKIKTKFGDIRALSLLYKLNVYHTLKRTPAIPSRAHGNNNVFDNL